MGQGIKLASAENNEAAALETILFAIQERRKALSLQAWPFQKPLSLRRLHWSDTHNPKIGKEFIALAPFGRDGLRTIAVCIDGLIVNSDFTQLWEMAFIEIINCLSASDLPNSFRQDLDLQSNAKLIINGVSSFKKRFYLAPNKSIKLKQALKILSSRPDASFSPNSRDLKDEIILNSAPIPAIRPELIDPCSKASLYRNGV